jgi:arylsulfatase A-like enzyme
MINNGQRVEHSGYTTDLITDLSLDWLKSRDKSKPFLLMCQHKAPHREWEPALRHLGHDQDRTYPEPETLFDDYSGRGLAERDQDMTIAKTMTKKDLKLIPPPQLAPEQRKAWDAYYEPRNEKFRQANLQGNDLVRWKYQRYMHDYLGTIKSVDESVGRLLALLDDEHLADNTIVVYAADQGFYLGEHGWFDKRWIYEQSFREPLMIRYPGHITPGTVVNAFVQNIDFGPTFLDIVGAAIPADMDGKSIVPLFSGSTPPTWRQSIYYHYYEWPTDHAVRQHYGIRGSRYKLTYFYTLDQWELYDLQNDPTEINNVAATPSYTALLDTMKRNLIALRIESKEAQPLVIPARTQAEKYYNMRSDSMRTTCFTSPSDGEYLSHIKAGNWLEYLINVPTNGQYRCYYRVAANAANGRIAFQAQKINTFGVDALLAAPSYTSMDTTTITNNGSLTTFHTDSTDLLTLQQGVYHVRLYFVAVGYNIDWVQWGLIQATQVSNTVKNADLNRFTVSINGDDIILHLPAQSIFGEVPAIFALYSMGGKQVWKHTANVSGSGPRRVRIAGINKGDRAVPSGVYVLQVSLSGASRTLLCSIGTNRE